MKKPHILILIALPIAIVGGIAAYAVPRSGLGLNETNLPKFITHHVIDPAHVYTLSKFRSGEGHDFSGGGEACRSMKHYFTPQLSAADEQYQREHQGQMPGPNGQTDEPIYAPSDGTIAKIVEEHSGMGRQIFFHPSAAPLTMRLFHVYPKDSLHAGQHLKGGEQIGVIAATQTTDIAVSIGQLPISSDTYVSYFDVMPDSLFAAYTQRGVTSRSQLIISRAERDANPLACGSGEQREMFVRPANYNPESDVVRLSGYVPRAGN